MNIFKKFILVNKITKAVEEIKSIYEENSDVADRIKEIIEDLIKLLEKIKDVVPAIDEIVTEIINIIKKWSKKQILGGQNKKTRGAK